MVFRGKQGHAEESAGQDSQACAQASRTRVFVRPLEGLLLGLVLERMQDPEGAAEKSSASLKTESKMFSFCPQGHKCRCPEEHAWERILKNEWWRPGYGLHRDGASCRYQWLFKCGPVIGQGIPGEKLGWGRTWWKEEALAIGDREERGATCQGQGSSEEWKHPPWANTTP